MMAFKSTRSAERVSLDEAIIHGLAPDGGLYVPDAFPQIAWQDFKNHQTLADFALHLLKPFFENSQIDFSRAFCQAIFNFPMPLHALTEKQYILELFQGPTLSFKDFGARFFAACLRELANDKTFTVMVATSGDTGSAVAAALHNQPGVKAIILFPDKQITTRQQAQITSWGDNIKALSVKGRFDDCQRLVKAAFADEKIRQSNHLTTANSINIGRLLPQMLFYAHSSVQLAAKHQQDVHFIVPSGNLGNVTACYWAKEMGFPIGDILIATNANEVLKNYWQTGVYTPQASIRTLANAMDVGNPSNIERLNDLFDDFSEFKRQLDVETVNDQQIRAAIKDCFQRWHYLICPHTATAYHRLQTLEGEKISVAVSTAHPVKFEEVIEPLLGIHIALPDSLKKILAQSEQFLKIEPQLSELVKAGGLSV